MTEQSDSVLYAVCDEDGDEHNSMLLVQRRCATLEEAVIVQNEHPNWRAGIFREVDGVLDYNQVPQAEVDRVMTYLQIEAAAKELREKQRGQEPVRYVITAACRYKIGENEYLIVGARHLDGVMQGQIKTIFQANPALRHTNFKWEQGFIDQDGVFMDRKEAMLVATAAGQINTRRPKGSPTYMLFSEDLH